MHALFLNSRVHFSSLDYLRFGEDFKSLSERCMETLQQSPGVAWKDGSALVFLPNATVQAPQIICLIFFSFTVMEQKFLTGKRRNFIPPIPSISDESLEIFYYRRWIWNFQKSTWQINLFWKPTKKQPACITSSFSIWRWSGQHSSRPTNIPKRFVSGCELIYRLRQVSPCLPIYLIRSGPFITTGTFYSIVSN